MDLLSPTTNTITFKYKQTSHTLVEPSSHREFLSSLNIMKQRSNFIRNLKSVSSNQTIYKNCSLPDIVQTPQYPFKVVYQKEQLRKGQNQLILEQLKKKYMDKHFSKLKILNHRCHYLCNSGNQLCLLSPGNNTNMNKQLKNKHYSFQSKSNLNNSTNNIRKGSVSFYKIKSSSNKESKCLNKSLIEHKTSIIPEMQVEEGSTKFKKKATVTTAQEEIITKKDTLNTSCDSDKLDYDNEIFTKLKCNESKESKCCYNKIEFSPNRQDAQKLCNNYNLSYLKKKFKILSDTLNVESCSKEKESVSINGVLDLKGIEDEKVKM